MSVFNKKNWYGKRCIWAFIPGWYDIHFDGNESFTNPRELASVESVGQRQRFYDFYGSTGSSLSRIDTVTDNYRHLGKCRTIRSQASSAANNVKLLYEASDLGINFPDSRNLTILSIFRPKGDGRAPNGGDPRIYTKDIGTAAADHDLMIGIANSGENARCRIRLGTTTQTIVSTETTIQDDALNLIAGGVTPWDATTNRGWVAHLREDGSYSDAALSNATSAYNPRTTTDIAIGASAGADDNAFQGDIIGIWAFDTSFYFEAGVRETLFREFFRNPWQVFAPQRTHVPIPTYKEVREITAEETGPAIIQGSITFALQADKQPTFTLTAETAATFLANLSMSQIGNTPTVTGDITFGLTADQTQVNTATRPVSFSTTLDLSQLESSVADKVEAALFALEADQAQTNIKVTGNQLTFNTNLDYTALNQLAANVTLTFGTNLDYQFSADGAGIVNAAISFIVQAQQAQTNVLTGDKAITFLMDAATQFNTQLDKNEALSIVLQASDQYIAGRGLNESITLGAELDQIQSNTLDKVLLMSFNALMDKNFNTAGSVFGPTIEFATTLASQFGTEGDVSGTIVFSTDMGQTQQSNKLTDVSMGFDVEASTITEIHLVAEGQVSFTSTMDQTEAKQLLGQSNLTFGHIHGLAALGSANFGADIAFGTIQNVQASGFNIQFEIFTPDSRTLRVYIEDRTIVVDGDTRITTIRRT